MPKAGKTTIATKFKSPLLLAFEMGFNAIPGVRAQVINKWSEFKKTLKMLDDSEVKEFYRTIIVDTADIAYEYCEDYVCSQNDVDQIKDIPYGGGYKLVQKEYDACLRKITTMGYGLVLISHATEKTNTDTEGKEYTQISPTLDKRGALVCERMCDIFGYVRSVYNEESKGSKSYLYLRETPRYKAGSRFKYIKPVIELNYDSLVEAINEAVDKEAAETGGQFLTEDNRNIFEKTQSKPLDFKALMAEFKELSTKYLENNGNPADVKEIVEKYLGKGKKIGDCTSAQAQQVDLIVFDLRSLVNE